MKTVAKVKESLIYLLAGKMRRTDAMFATYPDRYDPMVAESNNYIYKDSLHRTFQDDFGVTLVGARILLETGVARAVSRAYHCARKELELLRGDLDSVRYAYESISKLMEEWRPVFERMNTGPGEVEDLEEVLRLIELDTSEEHDFELVIQFINGEGMGEW